MLHIRILNIFKVLRFRKMSYILFLIIVNNIVNLQEWYIVYFITHIM